MTTAAPRRITCRGSRSDQTPAASTMPASITWRAARTTPSAIAESEISRTAKASATVEIPSPTPEIVLLEKRNRKLRSASAPSGSLGLIRKCSRLDVLLGRERRPPERLVALACRVGQEPPFGDRRRDDGREHDGGDEQGELRAVDDSRIQPEERRDRPEGQAGAHQERGER